MLLDWTQLLYLFTAVLPFETDFATYAHTKLNHSLSPCLCSSTAGILGMYHQDGYFVFTVLPQCYPWVEPQWVLFHILLYILQNTEESVRNFNLGFKTNSILKKKNWKWKIIRGRQPGKWCFNYDINHVTEVSISCWSTCIG